jgi:hypothetical protein
MQEGFKMLKNVWTHTSFVIAGLLLAACKPTLQGTATVEEPLTVNASYSSTKEKVNIPKGNYALSVSSGSVTTEFTLKDKSGKAYVFRTPVLSSAYDDYGTYVSTDSLNKASNLSYGPSELNQNFDLKVTNITSVKKKGAAKNGSWSCDGSCGYETVTVCTPVTCTWSDASGNCLSSTGGDCTDEQQEIYGSQSWEGYQADLSHQLNISLSSPGKSDQLGKGQVTITRSGIVLTAESDCECP